MQVCGTYERLGPSWKIGSDAPLSKPQGLRGTAKAWGWMLPNTHIPGRLCGDTGALAGLRLLVSWSGDLALVLRHPCPEMILGTLVGVLGLLQKQGRGSLSSSLSFSSQCCSQQASKRNPRGF